MEDTNMKTVKIYSATPTVDGHYQKHQLMECEFENLPPGMYIIETYRDNIPIDDETVEKL